MLAPMIAYCTNMNLNKCPNALGVGYHGTELRMMRSAVVMKTQRRAPGEGVVVSVDRSKV